MTLQICKNAQHFLPQVSSHPCTQSAGCASSSGHLTSPFSPSSMTPPNTPSLTSSPSQSYHPCCHIQGWGPASAAWERQRCHPRPRGQVLWQSRCPTEQCVSVYLFSKSTIACPGISTCGTSTLPCTSPSGWMMLSSRFSCHQGPAPPGSVHPRQRAWKAKTFFTIYSFQKNPTICPILRQHTDHANVWVRFLHKQGREVLLEQLVINNLKMDTNMWTIEKWTQICGLLKNGHKYMWTIEKWTQICGLLNNGHKYVDYYYHDYFSLEIWLRSILTLRRWKPRWNSSRKAKPYR